MGHTSDIDNGDNDYGQFPNAHAWSIETSSTHKRLALYCALIRISHVRYLKELAEGETTHFLFGRQEYRRESREPYCYYSIGPL